MEKTAAPRQARLQVATVVGATALLIGVALARLLTLGWGPVSPDDARYVYVGLSVLDGRGPLTADGTLFVLRSPVFGVLLALGSRAVPGGPLQGAHVVAFLVGALMLALALIVAIRTAAPSADRRIVVLATTAAILSSPLLWSILSRLHVDVAQTLAVLLVIVLMLNARPGRWLSAGVALGLAALVKEPAGLLIVLPAAWLGSMPLRRVLAGWARFAVAAAIVAGWWWIVVFVGAGEIFPFNALAIIERRQVGLDVSVNPSMLALLTVYGLGWLGILMRARVEVAARVLLVAFLALLPPAIYAFGNGLDARNYLPLSMLSCVAAGSSAADVLARWSARQGQRPAFGHLLVPAVLAAALAVGATVALQAPQARPSPLPDHLVAWIDPRMEPGQEIGMTFRFRAQVALEFYGRVPVGELHAYPLGASDDPASYVWIGLRDRQPFAVSRQTWQDIAGDSRLQFLVTVLPHPFAMEELFDFLGSQRGREYGFRTAWTASEQGSRIIVLEPTTRARSQRFLQVPLHISAEAAVAWLDLAGTRGDESIQRLIAARPIVVGDLPALSRLSARLAPVGCLERWYDDGQREVDRLIPCH